MRNELLLGMMAFAAGPAFGDDAGHWYFSPHAGGIWSDDDRAIEDHASLYGLSIGKHVGD